MLLWPNKASIGKTDIIIYVGFLAASSKIGESKSTKVLKKAMILYGGICSPNTIIE